MDIKDFKTKNAEELSEHLQIEMQKNFNEKVRITRQVSLEDITIKPKMKIKNGTI